MAELRENQLLLLDNLIYLDGVIPKPDKNGNVANQEISVEQVITVG